MKELELYVVRALKDGKSRADITSSLTSVGWSEEMINQAFEHTMNRDIHREEIAQTHALSHMMAKENLMYFLSYVTLIWSVSAFLFAAFAAIDMLLGHDATIEVTNRLRMGLANLVVVFPVFVVTTYYAHRHASETMKVLYTGSRRTFVYFLLGLFSIVFIFSAISLMYQVFSGDVASAAALKLLIVLATTVFLFTYFYGDVKRENQILKVKEAGTPTPNA